MRILLFFFLFPTLLIAQQAEREVMTFVQADFLDSTKTVYDANLQVNRTQLHGLKTDWIDIPVAADPFLAFSVAWTAPLESDIEIFYHFEGDEEVWTQVIPDTHFEKKEGRQVSTLIFKDKEQKRVRLHLKSKRRYFTSFSSFSKVELHFYSPGKTIAPEQEAPVEEASCPCPRPAFLNRQGWCPNGDCTEHPNPQMTDVTHLIVHHAASTNASSDWSGVVRSIWDFHVNTNGWDDIGYNWLIDPNGVVYLGRGDDIQGAHFCGNNGGTVGICMLGNFTNTTPTEEAREKLIKFLSWKSCDVNIDPEEMAFHNSSNKMLPRISGHQEGCATECPGALFFPTFPQLRSGVKNYQDQECQPVGIPQIESSDSSIEVFPNPSNGPIHLSFESSLRGAVVLKLYKIANAQVVQQWNFDKENFKLEQDLKIKNIGTGVFFFQLTIGKHTFYEKIVRP